VAIYRELEEVYTSRYYDFELLGELYEKEAILVNNLHTCDRTPSMASYFFVGLYGFGFEEDVRNSSWIYKGNAFEQLPDFRDQLQERYPQAQVLQYTDNPPKGLKTK